MPSTVIRWFGYHPSAKQLEILFTSGRRYFYHDVPLDVFEAMGHAFAKGEFFNAHIRDRFRFTPVISDIEGWARTNPSGDLVR